MANSTKKSQRAKQIENLNEQVGLMSSLASNIDPLSILQEIVGVKSEYPQKQEFRPGESIEISKSGIKTETKRVEVTSRWHELSVFTEEKKEVEKKIGQLRAELDAIIKEVKLLSKSTQNIREEIKAIPEQAPQNPGTYHLFFFEQVLKIIRTARLEIEKASIWLEATSKRTRMKYWNRYKKHGSSFLLSADHYLTRSAG
ncbi:MAG: hypothetical protein CH104c_0168 [Candidatus Woesebacteria bacterium]|jgi:hypothetical protein|nr:MAG: hypothetical protein CH104c_0168 [Candidatus Woesebacteria bacterium]